MLPTVVVEVVYRRWWGLGSGTPAKTPLEDTLKPDDVPFGVWVWQVLTCHRSLRNVTMLPWWQGSVEVLVSTLQSPCKFCS